MKSCHLRVGEQPNGSNNHHLCVKDTDLVIQRLDVKESKDELEQLEPLSVCYNLKVTLTFHILKTQHSENASQRRLPFPGRSS